MLFVAVLENDLYEHFEVQVPYDRGNVSFQYGGPERSPYCNFKKNNQNRQKTRKLIKYLHQFDSTCTTFSKESENTTKYRKMLHVAHTVQQSCTQETRLRHTSCRTKKSVTFSSFPNTLLDTRLQKLQTSQTMKTTLLLCASCHASVCGYFSCI